MPFRKLNDLPPPCQHPEHNQPSHRHLPVGRYEYECPGCGKKTTFTVGSLQMWEQAKPLEITTP